MTSYRIHPAIGIARVGDRGGGVDAVGGAHVLGQLIAFQVVEEQCEVGHQAAVSLPGTLGARFLAVLEMT